MVNGFLVEPTKTRETVYVEPAKTICKWLLIEPEKISGVNGLPPLGSEQLVN